MLDTNICIYLIKKKPVSILERFRDYSIGEIGVSTITVAELYYGVCKSQHSHQNEQALQQFLIPLNIVEFDQAAAITYGQIRSDLEKSRSLVGGMDMLIASHALSIPVVLVTNNLREFKRIPGLQLENWVE